MHHSSTAAPDRPLSHRERAPLAVFPELLMVAVTDPGAGGKVSPTH